MPRDKKPDDIARENAVPPIEPFGTQRTDIGTVKWWRDAKGYGVIAVERLTPWDVWCHFSSIDGEGFRTLTAGERVEVEYVRANQENFKYLAIRVRRLETG